MRRRYLATAINAASHAELCDRISHCKAQLKTPLSAADWGFNSRGDAG